MNKNVKMEEMMKMVMPTKLDLDAMIRDRYEESKSNKNNMSYWLPKVLGCGIKSPDTVIIPLNFSQYKWFGSDNYNEESIKAMGEYLKGFLNQIDFDTNRDLFIKTGNFSNKFDFSTCKVTNLDNLGQQFLDIYYTAMMVGAGNNSELVVREYIKNDIEKSTIYNGMPLNTEFRVFYNFDTNEVLGTFNYWDTKVVSDNLKSKMRYDKEAVEDYKNFTTASLEIEKEFEELKDKATSLVRDCMLEVDLQGAWSIDLMYVNGEFYLIDMALAHQSYYYDRVAHLLNK